MVGIIFFVSGAVGLLLSAIFFHIEHRRGGKVGGARRTLLDKKTLALYRGCVFGEIPRSYRLVLARVASEWMRRMIHALVIGLRSVERPLARIHGRLRARGYSSKTDKPPSSFLETIRPPKDGADAP